MRDFWTAQEIAASTGMPLGTIYRLAHVAGWRRTRTKPRGYRSADVLDTLRRRQLDSWIRVKDHHE